jgi:hypothetical protein
MPYVRHSRRWHTTSLQRPPCLDGNTCAPICTVWPLRNGPGSPGGRAERFELRNVQIAYESSSALLWITGAAEFQGTWATLGGPEIAFVGGTAGARLDNTPGLPGFIAPGASGIDEVPVPLKGMARASKRLCGQERLSLVAFDSAVAIDLEQLYQAIASLFAGDEFTWRDFLDVWEHLFGNVEMDVRIHTGTYTLALVTAEQLYREELRYQAYLKWYFHRQEYSYEASAWIAEARREAVFN